MTTIAITGASGQLGQELVKCLSNQCKIHALTRNNVDITDLTQTRAQLHLIQPDIIIHTAAYTSVDQAENNSKQAHQTNVQGTRHVAIVAEEINASLCYISTDYVFDGTSSKSYKEHDIPNPINVYGLTKFKGEQIIQATCSKYFIVRTSWLYGTGGTNFVKTMLQLAKTHSEESVQVEREKAPLQVVHDQIGSPTYAHDLARFISELVRTHHYGIYHASNAGACSWYEFAQAIFAEIQFPQRVIPITTAQFPRPARRPEYSVLDNEAIRTYGFTPLRPWRVALRAFLQE